MGWLKNWIAAAKRVIFVKNRLADDSGRWKRIYAGDAEAAEDELWGGSRPEEALGPRVRNEFVTIVGGLTEVENRFLDLSAAQGDKLRQEQEEQHRRELAAARKLAKTERQRAEVGSKARRRQRFFIIVLVGLLLLAGNMRAELLPNSTFTFTGLTFAKAKPDLCREEDPRFGDFSRCSC